MQKVSRRNFITTAALALGGTALLAGCSPSTSTGGSTSAASGSNIALTGRGLGKHGSVEVEVVYDGGKIADIHILKSRETPGLGDVAMEELGSLIIENQTLAVDTVSGATLSSLAFTTAIKAALESGDVDVSDWESRNHASVEIPADIPTTADVIVVGGGGAGLSAAITAAVEGKKVILLEKLGVLGGDTVLSGGEMAVPDNWIQVNAGLDDSPAKLAADMLTGGDNIGDPALVEVIANGALDSSQWLTFEGGVSWEPNLLFFGGHSIERSIVPKGHSGSEMTTKLTARCKTLGIDIIKNMRVTDLVKDGDGAVRSVKASDTITGKEYVFAAKVVVLTSGGFGSNVEMRVKYNPEMDETILSTDSVGATGDAVVMGEKIGADLIDMQYIQTYPVCDPSTGALLYVGDMRLESRAIMVNKEGDRFVEELGRRDVLSNAIKEQTDGIGYLLFNQKEADETKLLEIHADEYENLEERGIIAKGDTLEAVCAPFGVDAVELAKTVDRWNGFCTDGADTDFNYRSELIPIEGGPYYLLSYKPAVHYTMGGLHINTEAQVLDTDGAVIPGLFAAGEVAGHKMGTNRLGSCSMSDIYTFGRIAGKNASDFAE